MGTIQRYIGCSVLVTFTLALATLCLLVLLGTLIQQIHYYSDFSVEFFIRLLPVVMPFVVFVALPIAVLVAVVMVFGRMSAKGEIAAMGAHGIALGRASIPAFLLGLGGVFVLAYLQWEVIPTARYTKRNLVVREIRAIAKAGLHGRRTLSLKNILIHYRGLSGEVLLDVDGVMFEESGVHKGRLCRRFMARRGWLFLDETAARMYFVLADGAIQVFNPADQTRPSELVRFEGTTKLDIDIADVLKRKGKTLADLTMSELENALVMLRRHANTAAAGVTETAYPRVRVETEWHKRMATSLAPLLFALLAVPLGAMTRTTSRLAGLGLGCLPVLVLYYPLNTLAEALAASGTIPPLIVLWIPTVLLALAGVLLLLVMR